MLTKWEIIICFIGIINFFLREMGAKAFRVLFKGRLHSFADSLTIFENLLTLLLC